jgi:hypothetical protein
MVMFMDCLQTHSVSRRFLLVSFAVVALEIGRPAPAAEPANSQKDSEAARSANIEKGERLIKALATINRPPRLYNGVELIYPIFPADFDWKEYARVRAAIKELDANSEELWPAIVEHMTDTDYCFTVQICDSAVNYSRGDVCDGIARTWISPAYAAFMPGGDGRSLRLPVKGPKAFQKWCRARCGKTFVELEIDAAESGLSTIQEGDWRPKEIRDACIKGLRAQITKLRETNKPIHGSFFRTDFVCWYGQDDAARFRELYGQK